MTASLVFLFASGWISAVAIALLWAITLIVARRSPEPRSTFVNLAPNAISGSALLAAFGLAMRQTQVLWLALLLAISLVAFLIDLRIRLAAQDSGLRRRTD
ncbi:MULTISPECIES: hypothetical protein [Rhizobium/Agrobacterium group]|uniref:hypothetical protein n=1 Tax=Rhizobium/Agrobacterium group TaxID=227290 RepID=UPI0006B937A6|nr:MULTISPECIES: hypothetical protein [Rhizobium/Agrobacterium group]AOG08978.1 putative membrane protein [Agrobacterium sp. RAC06]KPF61199.1 hypothetical protein IP85_00995 [Rhizobium sp. AAP116]